MTDLSKLTPNAETIAAMADEGELFDGASWAIFSAILEPEWRPMDSVILDRFALYRMADGSGEIKGCIDTVRSRYVWIPYQCLYRPLDEFSGWKPLDDAGQ